MVVVFVTFVVLGGAAQATAHSELIESTPADGATMATAPDTASLTFNENISAEFAQAVVADASGRAQPVTPSVDGPRLLVPLPNDLAAGAVEVRYRVTSADGHPIAGQVVFTTEQPGPQAPDLAPTTPAASPQETEHEATDAAPAGNDDEGTTWIYALTGVAALVLIGLGALLFRWDRQHR